MALPPLLAGAVQLTVACPSPAKALGEVGAPGAVAAFIVTPGTVAPYELVSGFDAISVILKVPVIGVAGKVMGEVDSLSPPKTV